MRGIEPLLFLAEARTLEVFDPPTVQANRNAGGGTLLGPSSIAVGRQRFPSMPAGRSSDGPTLQKAQHMIRTFGRHTASFANIGVPVALLALIAASAHAFTSPAAGDLGYDIYDIVVNRGVKGPLGFVAGVAAFLFGVSRLFSNIMIGIPTIVAAVCLIKADSILQTFGMVI